MNSSGRSARPCLPGPWPWGTAEAEASKNVERVAPELVSAHPELPLAFAHDMRNLLAHGYYKVDVNVVWKTIERDLPYLQQQVT
ncbi:MAG: DUF86 domain-containing protein [Rhodoferax sp.]|nr:DUF86 domain-containing protein [Rhodoferax sp.]